MLLAKKFKAFINEKFGDHTKTSTPNAIPPPIVHQQTPYGFTANPPIKANVTSGPFTNTGNAYAPSGFYAQADPPEDDAAVVRAQREKLKILLDEVKEVLAELAGEQLEDFETVFKLYESPHQKSLSQTEMITVNNLYKKYKKRKEDKQISEMEDTELELDADDDDVKF